ncbi:MAG: NAD-dependent epimerase/dehydratase family protein [Actinomycetota bacterium]|nr:NAD-dependent epimerase/dehydratase family protein [Actinomycetota bacterium]
MKAFLTGATGFVGGHLAKKLRARGDDVVALVRSPHKAGELTRLGCAIVEGDLSDRAVMTAGMKGCDSVFHIAAGYQVGVFEDGCREMHESNIVGTENTLGAAVDAGVSRIVYVSTIGYYGNTRGEVVDETFERTDLDWLTCYDETKYQAHEVARRFITEGAPVLIAQPGGIYGPGDTSDLSKLLERIQKGWMKVLVMPGVGFNFVHVEDVIDGLLLVHDKGRLGKSYNLGGELATLGELIKKVAVLSGRKPPTKELPLGLIKRSVVPWRYLGPMMGFPPNLRELIKGSEGVTYWANDDKARRELGYSPRTLDVGLPDVVTNI